MGKRNTAKTGDKALYNARDKLENSKSKKNVDDDDMYNEVDRYHNAKNDLEDDMLRFGQKEESDEEGMQNNVEGVFDLGLDHSEDESESDESEEDSSDEDEPSSRKPLQESDDEDSEEDDDSSIDGFDENAEPDLLNWGKRKRDYYHGDTADLEIGQEVEDAELEEEGAKEILKARLEGMTENDFMLDEEDDSEDENEEDDTDDNGAKDAEDISTDMQSTKRRKLSRLSKKEKIKLMSKTHPELIPLVSHFRDEVIRPCADKTLVAVNALLGNKENAEAVGATGCGLQYLLTKAMLQTSTALNVCQYLMIKADQAASSINDRDADNIMDDQEVNIKNHPVISRLNQLNHLSGRLESKVESQVDGLNDQLENLVKASALMTGNDVSDGETSEMDSDAQDENSEVEDNEVPVTKGSDDESESASTVSSSDDEEEESALQKQLMNEARFALRKQDDEDEIDDVKGSKRRRRRALPAFSDFGDDNDANEAEISAAGMSLASTVNRITQRSKSKKVGLAPEVNDENDEERFRRGLEMMEAELGGDDDNFDDDDGELDDGSMDDEGDDFYAQIKKKSKAKKEYKKSMYAVAPKYPGMDEEIDGERAVGRTIMKNRGLVAHKNKLNRNPRVKKREQYRKALIKRKGAVREVRTEEGHKYGGETTGIKSGLSRSRKLGVK